MKYRIKKETKPKLPTYGKYKAVAVHEQTITSEQIIQEAAELHILSEVKGYYWSSTLHSTEHSGYACRLIFDTAGISMDYGSRYYGRSVRPVRVSSSMSSY